MSQCHPHLHHLVFHSVIEFRVLYYCNVADGLTDKSTNLATSIVKHPVQEPAKMI